MAKIPQTPLKYALGIDAGTASVGWAIVELTEKNEPHRLLLAGVRRFDAGVEGDIERGKDESLSTKRRLARGPRRQTWRRQWRLRKVFRALQKIGLLPNSESDDHDARHAVLQTLDEQLKQEVIPAGDRVAAHVFPYRLRALALDQPLELYALGRAFYHLAQRRGYLSNLKAGRKDDEVGAVKQGISELAGAMKAANARTLGQYFASLDPEEINQRIRKRWTSRKMYRHEFEEIWKTQAPHHASLTEESRALLEEAIFHQRPLKSQEALIGRCELEKFKRRIAIASRPFQRFRMLQRLNDLMLTCPDYEIRRLTDEERNLLLVELASQGDLSWAVVKKLLKLKKSREYGRHFEFNFEQGGDKKLVGHRTDAKMIIALGDAWSDLSEEMKTALVDDVLRFEDEEELLAHLQQQWKLTSTQAQQVADVSFEPGYGSHSRRAIKKLLTPMEKGEPYATARKQLYGESISARPEQNRLPPFFTVMPSVRNPAVARTMTELRKVVNALIQEFGKKPEYVRIELARDLKNSRDRRDEMSKQRDKNTDSRDNARRRILDERGEKWATPHNILKVRLADECNWVCPYTGRGISMETLVSDESHFDVEHIIPFSRSLDNSFANKTLCYHDENRHRKAGNTPFQAYGHTNDWEEILQRVRHFQGPMARRKLQLFERETLLDDEDFIERQLSDTRYLSRVAADYLAALYGGRIDQNGTTRVQPSPGGVTKFLRDAWELNRIVGDPDDPQQKNRADHRHHAIDAFVIAVSTPKIVKALNEAAARAEKLGTRHLLVDVETPWTDFTWQDVRQKIDDLVVSSRVNRKLNGGLHKDTIFSKPFRTLDPKSGKEKTVHHVRKPLEKMSRAEIDEIVDLAVRIAVIEKLEKIGSDPAKAFADRGNHPYLTAKDGRIIPIHTARIRKADTAIAVGRGAKQRYVAPGDNHHMEIVASLDQDGQEKRWDGVIVSRYDANCRGRDRQPGEVAEIVRKDHGPDRRLKFTLAGGEHLAIPGDDRRDRILRVTVISAGQIELVDHCDARPITIRKKIPGARTRLSIDKLRQLGAKKVVIDPLGKAWPAGD